MKKLFSTFFLSAILLTSCNNDESIDVTTSLLMSDNFVTVEEAEFEVNKLLQAIDGNLSRSNNGIRRIQETHTISPPGHKTRSGDEELWYIFNFEEDQGYAIYSSDRTSSGLLALTEKGKYDIETELDFPPVTEYLNKIGRGKYSY